MVRAIEAEYLLNYEDPNDENNNNGIEAFLQDSSST